jgi:hypothetical protein
MEPPSSNPGSTGSTSPAPSRFASAPRGRRTLYAIAAVVVVVIVLVVAVALLHAKPSSASGPDVLIPALSLTSLTAGQLAAVNFIVNTPSVLNGTFSTEFATTFYLLTPDEYSTYLLHSNLPGYEWTNVTHGFVSYAHLYVEVPPGQWVFTMINTNETQASGVGWITALTLGPS